MSRKDSDVILAHRNSDEDFLRTPIYASHYILFSFSPPKQETFFKDDANHDPQWLEEEIISANFEFNGLKIG